MAGEKLRQYIQGKWERGSYGRVSQSEVDLIVSAIRRYAGVAREFRQGRRFTNTKVDVSEECIKGCRIADCVRKGYCIGRDQSIYTHNEVTGLKRNAREFRDKKRSDEYGAILDDLSSLGR